MNKISSLVFACAALVLASCGQNKGQQQVAVEETAPIVNTYVAQRQEVPQESVYSSTVLAYAVNNIASQSAGRIVKLNVEIGDFVYAGQILAEMDRSQLSQIELKLKNEKDELERVRALLGQGGISQSDFEQMELAYNVSKSSFDNLQENTILRSPINGVVTERNYDKGDMYAMSKPVYTVQQITPVKLLVAVSESDYSRIDKGDDVSLTVDALPGKVFSGKVSRVYPVIDATSHTVNVEVIVSNTDRMLRPGMYARVTVNFGSNNSVVVPDMAVIKQQGSGQRLVYVVESDNTVSIKPVTLGKHIDQTYEILDGIAEGETVVVKGHSLLKSGIKVEVAQ